MLFRDRVDAGRQLAARLEPYRDRSPYVLGLPRGGLVVAAEVARTLDAPLDVWVSRKLGTPGQPELGMGALSEGGVLYLDHQRIAEAGVRFEEVERVAEREAEELERRVQQLREGRPPPSLAGHTALLVDDGVATGVTALAALRSVRAHGRAAVVLAAPVAAAQALPALEEEADEVVCLESSWDLWAIGAWYEHFPQVSDAAVLHLLQERRGARQHAAHDHALAP